MVYLVACAWVCTSNLGGIRGFTLVWAVDVVSGGEITCMDLNGAKEGEQLERYHKEACSMQLQNARSYTVSRTDVVHQLQQV